MASHIEIIVLLCIGPLRFQKLSIVCILTEFILLKEEKEAVLPQRHNLPWLSKEIIQLIKKRDHHFKKAQHGSAADRAKFRELRNEVVAKLRSGKRSFFADLESSNVNQFWKKIRLLNRKESSIPTLSTGDITASTNPEKAELLNEYFSSNFNSAVPALDYSSIPTALPDDFPDEILCTEEDVFALLSTLDCSKASGADDISARMLKMTAFSIAAPIFYLLHKFLTLPSVLVISPMNGRLLG